MEMSKDAPNLDGKVVIGDSSAPTSKTEKVVAHINGETHEVEYDGSSTILETLTNHGLNAPYSCMDGACMACLGKVVRGKVYQDDMCILSDDNIAEKETLTCQAKPASTIVEIHYDEI